MVRLVHLPVFVHLVRHGEVDNPRALSYGRLPGFRLSEAGRAQARVTADYLHAFGGNVKRVISSPLERAQETAEIVCSRLELPPANIDERLIEAGSWRDGLPRSLSPLAYARRYFNFGERKKVEPPAAIAKRMRAAIEDAATHLNEGESVALVSHQTPIWWARVALERGVEAFARAYFENVTPWIYVRSPCDLASVTTVVLSQTAQGAKPSFRYFAP